MVVILGLKQYGVTIFLRMFHVQYFVCVCSDSKCHKIHQVSYQNHTFFLVANDQTVPRGLNEMF